MSAGIMGSPPFPAAPGRAVPAMKNVAGNPGPLTPKAGPVRRTMAELGQQASSHDLIPVPPGGGALSGLTRELESIDLIRGMDELIGRTDMKLGSAYSRTLRGRRPGDVSTHEACGRLSGRLYA